MTDFKKYGLLPVKQLLALPSGQQFTSYHNVFQRSEADFKLIKQFYQQLPVAMRSQLYFSTNLINDVVLYNNDVILMAFASTMLADNDSRQQLINTYCKHTQQQQANQQSINDITWYASVPTTYIIMILENLIDRKLIDVRSQQGRETILTAYSNSEGGFDKFDFAKHLMLSRHSDSADLQALAAATNGKATLTIYRGVTANSASVDKALSWTLDYDIADMFAHRFAQTGHVLQAHVKAADVIAYIDGGEKEVLVPSTALTNVISA